MSIGFHFNQWKWGSDGLIVLRFFIQNDRLTKRGAALHPAFLCSLLFSVLFRCNFSLFSRVTDTVRAAFSVLFCRPTHCAATGKNKISFTLSPLANQTNRPLTRRTSVGGVPKHSPLPHSTKKGVTDTYIKTVDSSRQWTLVI